MKKILCLLLIVISVTGCSITKMNYSSYDAIINQVLSQNISLNNNNYDGFKFYLPKNLSILDKSDRNFILKYESSKIYLYIDMVSYYHHSNDMFSEDKSSFYSKHISYDDKFGYVEINKLEYGYFVEIMYNYAKIEVYAKEVDINDIINSSMTILSSISYNDSVIESLIGNNSLNYSEETYNIFEPKKDDTDSLEIVTYEGYTGEININEDSIKLDETEE